MSVRDIMTTPVVSVEMDDELGRVRDIFANTHFHHLLVVEHNQLFGIISDRDLFKAISPNIGKASEKASDLITLNKKAHQIMARNPITITQDSSIFQAVELFNTHRISCLPVVDKNNRPVGIVSWRDILKAIKPRKKAAPEPS